MAEGAVDISHSLVWAKRIHRWWTKVPASVRVAVVAVLSGWLGALSDQPLQMKVFLAVATTVYAALGFMLISDALSSWLPRLPLSTGCVWQSVTTTC